ncbi:hypothetical protein SAMN04488098_10545 [Alkalibacterium thalassium]|uniref:Uncharacterized protein n=2 Tax=Alkalibacterium thalassium TaxID=426701 RepID=A0A1G9E4Z8_9LACT|nr:hypothetical protein SAMN04488098_10545 [Alkalibacterium thalassium]
MINMNSFYLEQSVATVINHYYNRDVVSLMKRSMIRNTLKFLPWQFGHMSTIYGIYYGFDSLFPVIYLMLSIGLAGKYIVMAFTRKDGRHLADLIAGSMVVKKRFTKMKK